MKNVLLNRRNTMAANNSEKVYVNYNVGGDMVVNNYNKPKTINFNKVGDIVIYFGRNYKIAGATGLVTDFVFKGLSASTIVEFDANSKDFGMDAKKGQRYVVFGDLLKNRIVKTVPRLGGGEMKILVCSKYEVKEFFRRLRLLDIDACNNEDLKAIQKDLQVVGRVLQEIAIDMAKDATLDAGVNLMELGGGIKALSILRKKDLESVSDNSKEVFSMVREYVRKTMTINTGELVESIPNFEVSINNYEDTKLITDALGLFQNKLVEAETNFLNDSLLPVVSQAGVTEEDLAVKELADTNRAVVKELKELLNTFRSYTSGLESAEDETASLIAAADKEIKLMFRDQAYAIGRSYGHDEATTRQLVYAASMLRNGSIDIASANLSSVINIIGEEDTMLMWSNEAGIVRDSVEVELTDVADEMFDCGVENISVEFINNVAYGIDGEELAFGGLFDNLNSKGMLYIDEQYRTMFIAEADKELAPIGNTRITTLNKIYTLVKDDNNNVIGAQVKPYAETTELERVEFIKLVENSAIDRAAYLITETKTGIKNAVGIQTLGKNEQGQDIKMTSVIGTAISLGNGYHTDMFTNGERKQKKHTVDRCMATERGMLIFFSC